MNFSFELPEDVLITTRKDLKELLRETLQEISGEDIKQGEIMTIKQTAEYLKVSVPTVRNLISNKEIPFFQSGQVIRINRKDVQEWMRKNQHT